MAWTSLCRAVQLLGTGAGNVPAGICQQEGTGLGNVCLVPFLLQMPSLCPVSQRSRDQAIPILLSLVAETHT